MNCGDIFYTTIQPLIHEFAEINVEDKEIGFFSWMLEMASLVDQEFSQRFNVEY